ncbi:ArdC family protein [Holdemania massiliensis]|uniref:ArdC family protein n=1 Tax=Holdemania massiliensis TaxID=1468449 RepID=UPI001F068C5B|nr:zincin-like metallopeptidase domain-containing protein [Holdemania massiliensis]MCH1942430.1 zincin-like metallopeptidase domain-containing protein [Holdemania massiliensis]
MSQNLMQHRQKIADVIVARMEDAIEWKKPWITAVVAPYNEISKKKYRGSNNLYLSVLAWEKGYQDPRWMTFKQLKDKGYHLQAGSKGAEIGYYRVYDKVKKRDLDFDWWNTLTLEQQANYRENIQFVFRSSVVFNGSCIDGLEPFKAPARNNDIKMQKSISYIADNMGVGIYSDGGSRAFYRSATDDIHLPESSCFWDQAMYDATMLHELAHATGHPTRLNRDMSGFFGSPEYAKEELRAEISSFFVSQELGCPITTEVTDNHIAYLQNWINAIKSDNSILFEVIKESDTIADYMISKSYEISAVQYDEDDLEL